LLGKRTHVELRKAVPVTRHIPPYSSQYPVEKLLRDCQAALVEDGENNVLGLNAVSLLSQAHQQKNPQVMAGALN
jgi:hypothetical protein